MHVLDLLASCTLCFSWWKNRGSLSISFLLIFSLHIYIYIYIYIYIAHNLFVFDYSLWSIARWFIWTGTSRYLTT
jgi:hypothetical protein